MALDIKGTKTPPSVETTVTDPILSELHIVFGWGDRAGSVRILPVSFSDPGVQVPEMRFDDDPSDPDPNYQKVGTDAGWAMLNALFSLKAPDGSEHPETARLEKTFGNVADQHLLVAGEAILVALLERRAAREAATRRTDLQAVLDRLTAQRAANSNADAVLDAQITTTQAQIKMLESAPAAVPGEAAVAVTPKP